MPGHWERLMMTKDAPAISRVLIEHAVADYYAALRARDADAWVAAFSPEGTRFDPSGASAEGHAELKALFEHLCDAVERISVKEDLVLISGDGAAVKWSGGWQPLRGEERQVEGIEVFEVDERGRIQTVWSYWDAPGILGPSR